MNRDEKEILDREMLERIAGDSGLAVVPVTGEQSATVFKSNNNSICEILYNSDEFAPRCAEYCGRAVPTAHAAGRAVHVKCHADLNFMTVPIKTEEKNFAVIVGRTFLKSEDYRKATQRAAVGDWQQFAAEELFENVLISGSTAELEKAAAKIEKLKVEKVRRTDPPRETSNASEAVAREDSSAESSRPSNCGVNFLKREDIPQPYTEKTEKAEKAEKTESVAKSRNSNPENALASATKGTTTADIESRKVSGGRVFQDAEEASAWRSFFGSLLECEYKAACASLLEFLSKRYGLVNLAWLERRLNHLEAVFAAGKFAGQSIQIKMSADDERLLEVLQKETALELRERKTDADRDAPAQTIWLFPVAVGGEIRGALIAGDPIVSDVLKRQITKFNRQIAPQIEILRLREELRRQSVLADAVRRFNERVQRVETEDMWTHLAEFCAELMRAERGSLLFYDEDAQKFVVRAATGRRAEIIRHETETLGQRVARGVFQSGDPLLVESLAAANIAPAPPDWKYKTDSFISFPISAGGRRIGVLNVTDRAGGEKYDDFDLELLNSIAPQLAVALDRAALERKAGEYEQLSVTDALTGLYNRRYLEARLAEEIARSQRHGFPMSFLMIDVDEFKSYNDRFGHGAGDRALQTVAHGLKATLRGADVAARYGGEEFSILLPQTNLSEARWIAERVRQKIERTEFPNRQVTVSIGVSSCSMKCTMQSLMDNADKALYTAKESGRNNVQFYDGDE